MLHGAILRSPYAHARIVSIDTSAALEHPASTPSSPPRTWRRSGLAWMPTISYDMQAVLAGDKVRFQGQEVAFVIADGRVRARDALELIDVEYEPLPVVVNARKALDPDAPLIRDDKEGQVDNLASPTWEAGDEDGRRARVRRGRRRRRARHDVPALPSRADGDVRHDRRLQPGDRASWTSTTATRRPTPTAPSTRTWPGCPST